MRWAAGYRYDDPTILGFSHTHFSGAGHSDLGDVLVMPVGGRRGAARARRRAQARARGYRSRFSHDERGRPAGLLRRRRCRTAGVRAELTAGTRIGVHRYTFPKGKAAHLVLDLRSSHLRLPGQDPVVALRLRPDGTVTGMRETRGWAPGRAAVLRDALLRAADRPRLRSTARRTSPTRASGRRAAAATTVAERQGRALVARLDFGRARPAARGARSRSPRSTRRARSPTSTASRAASTRSARATRAAWEQALGRGRRRRRPRRCAGRSTPRSTTRSSRPSVMGDADGRYRGPDNAVHQRRRLHLPLDLLAVGHLPRRASAAHAVQPTQRNADIVRSLLASAAGEPVRHPAGLAVPRPRDVDDDRLPRRPGHRRRLSEGHPRLRRRTRRWTRWSRAPPTRPTAASATT